MVHIKTPYCLITMKKVILGAITLFLAQNLSAQSLNKMQWFNEPEKWEIKNNALIMKCNGKQ